MSDNRMKKKVLIILNSDLYVRNYVTTNAFSTIENDFECSYLLSDKIKLVESFHEDVILRRYRTDKSLEAQHYRLFDLLMWRYRHKSTSFQFRAMRGSRLVFTFPEKGGGATNITVVFWQTLRWVAHKAFRFIRINNVIFPIYFNWYKRTLKINADLEENIKARAPDIILFPCSAYDPDGTDVVRIGISSGIATVFLVDNWDNLSSKSILWAKPTYVGVWGEQSVQHAIDIQGFRRAQITCLGTPRFDQYFRVRDFHLKSEFDFKYILFVGTALAFDEADVLIRLNEILSTNRDIFDGVKIVYRPHPWRHGSDSIFGKHLQNVIIDPQLLKAYSSKDSSQDVQPHLSYYPSLLKNAEFVIGGLTSMLIESLIFRKRFLALVYDDGKNFTNQHNAFKYYTHFQGLRSVSALSFCESIDELEKVFIDTWMMRSSVNVEEVDSQRRYFYFDDSRTYAQRLSDLCRSISNSDNYANCTASAG